MQFCDPFEVQHIGESHHVDSPSNYMERLDLAHGTVSVVRCGSGRSI